MEDSWPNPFSRVATWWIYKTTETCDFCHICESLFFIIHVFCCCRSQRRCLPSICHQFICTNIRHLHSCSFVYSGEGPLPGAAQSAGVSTVGGGTKDVLSCLRPYTTQMATWRQCGRPLSAGDTRVRQSQAELVAKQAKDRWLTLIPESIRDEWIQD